MPRTRGGIAIAGAATAGALVALALGAVDLPDPGPALSDASRSLGGWTYLVVPVLAFLETGAFVGLSSPARSRSWSAVWPRSAATSRSRA